MTYSIEDLQPMLERLRLAKWGPQLADLLKTPEGPLMPAVDVIYRLSEQEIARRDEMALNRRLKLAKIKYPDAAIESIDFKTPRGLNKRQILSLAACDWIKNHQNLIITGKTGVGKTYIGAAFAVKACCLGYNVRFMRVPRMLKRLSACHQIGTGVEDELSAYRRADLLVLDDWGIGEMDASTRSDLLEIIEDRYESGSVMITSVLPVKSWAAYIGDQTYADSILDRVIHSSYRIDMTGESMRDQAQYGAVS